MRLKAFLVSLLFILIKSYIEHGDLGIVEIVPAEIILRVSYCIGQFPIRRQSPGFSISVQAVVDAVQ